MKRTPRGFAIFKDVVDSRGNTVRVQMSSATGGPFCWLFTKNRDGQEYTTGHAAVPDGISVVSPHLTRVQARRVAAALLKFADGAE